MNYIVRWGTNSACGNLRCYIHIIWWYDKCCVGWWISPNSLDFLVDTTNPIVQSYCSKILWSKWKSDKYIYISEYFMDIGNIIFLWNLLLKGLHKYTLQNLWAIMRCKNRNLNLWKNTKINSSITVALINSDIQPCVAKPPYHAQ